MAGLGGFSKDKLVYDPSVPVQGDNVGAFLRAGYDGDPISSTAFFAQYTGIPGGASTPVTIKADSSGPIGNITLTGDGVKSIATLISDWNAANPTNTITLVSGTGTQVPSNGATFSLGDGAEALDVKIVGGINLSVDLNGIYDLGANPTPDNVGIVAFERAVSPALTNQKLLPTGAGLGNVLAADISKVHALDVNAFGMGYNTTTGDWQKISIDNATGGINVAIPGGVSVTQGTSPWIISGSVTQSGTWTVGLSEDHNWGAVGANTLRTASEIGNASGMADFGAGATSAQTLRVVLPTDQTAIPIFGNVADDAVDAGNPVKIGSRVEAGPLTAVSAAGDRADAISDLYRRLYVNNGANIGILAQKVLVNSGGQVAFPTSALAGRRTIMIQNLSNQEIYVGQTGITAGQGFVVAARATLTLDIGQNVTLYGIGASASNQDIRVFEMA